MGADSTTVFSRDSRELQHIGPPCWGARNCEIALGASLFLQGWENGEELRALTVFDAVRKEEWEGT